MNLRHLKSYGNLDEDVAKKASNASFVRKLIKAFEKFPDNDDPDNDDPEEVVSTAAYFQKALEKGRFPTSYLGLPYKERKELRQIMTDYKIPDTLTPKELEKVQAVVRPKYEKFIAAELTDEKIEKAFKWVISRRVDQYSNEGKFLDVKMKDMPDLLRFVKDKMIDTGIGRKDWESFSVDMKFKRSENSAVVSSSFSTYYYYDITVKFAGRTFKGSDILVGSNYYSGGWS